MNFLVYENKFGGTATENMVNVGRKLWPICALILLSNFEGAHATIVPSRSQGTIRNAIALTAKQIEKFLSLHNDARRSPAPRASNMRKMTWDSELADIAVVHTRLCRFENNQNISHSRFGAVGEIMYLSQNGVFTDNFIPAVVNSFLTGKDYLNVSTMACSGNSDNCGKYSQVVRAETFKLGCGITECATIPLRQRIIQDSIIVVCNYAPSGSWKRNPPYSIGKPCSECHDSDSCERKLCTNVVRDTDNPPTGQWRTWSEWSACSATCGFSTKKRTRSCNTFVKSDCSGAPTQMSLYCAPLRDCPRDVVTGSWGEWVAWTSCSKSCGGGRRERSRACDTGNDQHCNGPSMGLSICNPQSCPSMRRAPWKKWDEWSDCTKSCGGGIKFRSRKCSSDNAFHCCGESHEVRTCSTRQCPRATWSRWGRWHDVTNDSCTSTTQVRSRSCSSGRSADCCVDP